MVSSCLTEPVPLRSRDASPRIGPIFRRAGPEALERGDRRATANPQRGGSRQEHDAAGDQRPHLEAGARELDALADQLLAAVPGDRLPRLVVDRALLAVLLGDVRGLP